MQQPHFEIKESDNKTTTVTNSFKKETFSPKQMTRKVVRPAQLSVKRKILNCVSEIKRKIAILKLADHATYQ